MKTLLAIPAALLAWTAIAPAHPFETQAKIEGRYGGRFSNGAETPDFKIMSYLMDSAVLFVLYVNGVCEGELYFRTGAMPDMEIAGILETNKGPSVWQIEKIEGGDKQTTGKAWSRKDGKLYALVATNGTQSMFLIGTKKAERIMGDLKKMEERVKLRDRMQ